MFSNISKLKRSTIHTEEKAKKRSKSNLDGLDAVVNPRAKYGNRKVIDGWKIYKEEELKIGHGGGTPLCPFDCNCCYA